LGGGEDLIDIEEALAYIAKRKQVLGGVVLSGGEPLLYSDLPAVITKIKSLGLAVKLDTNGTNPLMLEKICSDAETRPDYIALDLKISPKRYIELVKDNSAYTAGLTENLIKSAALVYNSQIPHEYRTLALPNSFISNQDIEELAPLVDGSPWYFRSFRPGNCLDPAWDTMEAPGEEAAKILANIACKSGKNGNCPRGGTL
jgi:pyruvate formate lyase activating enzyme